MHTKRDVPIILGALKGPTSRWRNCLLKIFRTKASIAQCIKVFEQESRVGMLTSVQCIMRKELFDKTAPAEMKKFFASRGLPLRKYAFVAGTMFMSRASLLKAIKDFKFKQDDFPLSSTNRAHSLAHSIERLLGYVTYTQNYIIRDPAQTSKQQKNTECFYSLCDISRVIRDCSTEILRFFYQNKKTEKKHIIKIIKIPIFHKKWE